MFSGYPSIHKFCMFYLVTHCSPLVSPLIPVLLRSASPREFLKSGPECNLGSMESAGWGNTCALVLLVMASMVHNTPLDTLLFLFSAIRAIMYYRQCQTSNDKYSCFPSLPAIHTPCSFAMWCAGFHDNTADCPCCLWNGKKWQEFATEVNAALSLFE
jgi:hypothetical protein